MMTEKFKKTLAADAAENLLHRSDLMEARGLACEKSDQHVLCHTNEELSAIALEILNEPKDEYDEVSSEEWLEQEMEDQDYDAIVWYLANWVEGRLRPENS